MVRHNQRLVPWKHYKKVAAGLKPIYQTETVEAADARGSDFRVKPGRQILTMDQPWQHNREHIILFLAYI